MAKLRLIIFSILLVSGLVACGEKKVEEGHSASHINEGKSPGDSIESDSEKEYIKDKEHVNEPDKQVKEEKSKNESTSVEDEQKQMAIDTLKGLVENANDGRVYKLGDGIYVGKTKRNEVYDLIGEPEEKGEFDRYHGSMGNASYDLAYDDKDVLKEARYRGTNVERQTNLGGITVNDLKNQIGEPNEIREISKTDEKNYIYRIGQYELQFVMDASGTADHVNLLKQ
ncbi:YjgB family protein [Bacillus sp. IITD106]|nr:YjgB family protein [Bacillus sp. IITD106]